MDEWECIECEVSGTYEEIRKPFDLGLDLCPFCWCEVSPIEEMTGGAND